MMRNNQKSVIVNNAPPIPKPISTEVANPIATTPNPEAVNQLLAVEANKESLLIPNKISGNAVHAYKVTAKSGQLLSVSVIGNGVLLSILNEQGVGIPGTVNLPSTELDIQADGTYLLQLRAIAGAPETLYQLKVALKDKAIASPPTMPPSGVPTPPTGVTTPPTSPSPSATPSQAPAQIEIKVRNR